MEFKKKNFFGLFICLIFFLIYMFICRIKNIYKLWFNILWKMVEKLDRGELVLLVCIWINEDKKSV